MVVQENAPVTRKCTSLSLLKPLQGKKKNLDFPIVPVNAEEGSKAKRPHRVSRPDERKQRLVGG